MRQLTFRGFVTQYVQSLSLTGTLSLSKLFEEMTTQNARLKAPLFAYAVESGKLHTLLNVCRENQAVFAEYTALYEMLNKNEDVKWSSDTLPPEYQKVWNSFCAVKRQGERDDRVKQLMADKITAIQQQKVFRPIACARICSSITQTSTRGSRIEIPRRSVWTLRVPFCAMPNAIPQRWRKSYPSAIC